MANWSRSMASAASSGSFETPEMTADRQPTIHIPARTVLLTAALGTMLAPLNSTMIVVAPPEILDDFGHSLAWGSWIVISYLVAMAAVQPLGGSLGDRYGRRRMLLIGLTAFLAATVVAALAPSVEVLLVARTVQALSGAMAIPNGTALVRSLIPPERQGRTFGTIGSPSPSTATRTSSELCCRTRGRYLGSAGSIETFRNLSVAPPASVTVRLNKSSLAGSLVL